MISPGFAFLSKRPSYPTEHLHIVISPIIDGKVLLVNVTSKKFDSDDTCVLCVGDHEFIKHDSVINYADAHDPEIDKMQEAILQKIFKPQPPVSEALLRRIQAGALISPAFKPAFIKYIPT
jgi:hypothetical protein